MWTRFMDMHSGGNQKLDWAYVYIEADEDEAVAVFQNRFGRDPYWVTCDCCGGDYSISTNATLEEATAYDRGCAWIDGAWREQQGQRHTPYQTLDEYLENSKNMVLYLFQKDLTFNEDIPKADDILAGDA